MPGPHRILESGDTTESSSTYTLFHLSEKNTEEELRRLILWKP